MGALTSSGAQSQKLLIGFGVSGNVPEASVHHRGVDETVLIMRQNTKAFPADHLFTWPNVQQH